MDLIISVFKLFFCLAFLIAALHTLVSYLFLWVAHRAHLFTGPRLPFTPGRSLCFWLQQMAKEGGLLFLKTLTYPLFYWRGDLPFKRPFLFDRKTHKPILFVNGYFCTQAIWIYLIAQLKKQLPEHLFYTRRLTNPLTPIPEAAADLYRELQNIRTETGSDNVIVLGFSMGGLVASYMAQYLAQPQEIAKVITLGTPFGGTPLAAFGIGENARQMLPHSTLLTALASRLQNTSIPYYCVATQMDHQVLPWESALPSQDLPLNRLLILEDVGHLGLLFSPAVCQKLLQWMRD